MLFQLLLVAKIGQGIRARCRDEDQHVHHWATKIFKWGCVCKLFQCYLCVRFYEIYNFLCVNAYFTCRNHLSWLHAIWTAYFNLCRKTNRIVDTRHVIAAYFNLSHETCNLTSCLHVICIWRIFGLVITVSFVVGTLNQGTNYTRMHGRS